jgi:hypothetical protein
MNVEIKNIQNFIADGMDRLQSGIVAVPANRKYLEAFANSNQGSMDMVLMQLSINYGYKIALEDLQDEIKDAE